MSDKKLSVYLETSVISHLSNRPSQNTTIALFQSATREWWAIKREKYNLVVSSVVLEEISQGNLEASKKRVSAIKEIKLLQLDLKTFELGNLLIKQKIIPEKAERDAFHIALTMTNKIDCLLSWNCRHIVNVLVS